MLINEKLDTLMLEIIFQSVNQKTLDPTFPLVKFPHPTLFTCLSYRGDSALGSSILPTQMVSILSPQILDSIEYVALILLVL